MNPTILLLVNTFEGMFSSLIVPLPNLLISLVLIGLGWLLGSSFEKILLAGAKSVKLNGYVERVGLKEFFSPLGIHLDLAVFFALVVKWFIFIAFLLAGFEAGGIPLAGMFIQNIFTTYVAKILTVTLVMYIAFAGSKIVRGVSYGILSSFSPEFARLPSIIAGYTFILSSFLFLISQMGLDPELYKVFFTGFIFSISLAFGIAFGLGGKETAGKMWEKMYKDIHKE